MRTNSRLLLWLLFFAAFVPRSFAFRMEPVSIDELTKQSSLVLHGTVLSKSCQRDAQGRIYTKVELEVAEVWKGSLSAKRFTVVHGGGILGEKRAVVSGQVEYGIGEEVVAFLVLNQRGEGVTLGLMRGKFRVWKDTETGEVLAQNPFHGAERTSDRVAKAGAPVSRSRLTLGELKRRVQEGSK